MGARLRGGERAGRDRVVPPGSGDHQARGTPQGEWPVSASPIVTEMRVVPVAGYDSMLLNLSGAHGPFFTRNVVVLRDNSGRTGVGEVPGGEKIRQTLEESVALVMG